MNSFEFNCYGNDIVAFDNTLFAEFPADLFDPKYLRESSLLCGGQLSGRGAPGRGEVSMFTLNGHVLILRHYFRGGAMANVTADRYLWTGLKKSRAIKELQMLSDMRGMGLPVPEPVAAHIHRMGATYTADIVTKFIPGTKTLGSYLCTHKLPKTSWIKLGMAVRQMHKKKCNHADLNAHNILLDEHFNVFLIDFDKSRIEPSSGKWQMKNIERLKRSLEKLSGNNNYFHYTSDDFVLFMRGYAA